MIKSMQDKLEEHDERYKEARQSEIELGIFKQRMGDVEAMKDKIINLESECLQLRKQNDILLNDHGKVKEMQKTVEFH